MVIQAVAEIEVRVEDYSQAVMVVAFNTRVVRPFNTSTLNTSLRFHSSRALLQKSHGSSISLVYWNAFVVPYDG